MVNDISPERLRALTARATDGTAVLSLFLDLDPSQLPTPPAREAAVDSLLSDARKALDQDGLDHAERVGLREALDLLAGRLLPSAGMTAEGARAMAAFLSVDGSPIVDVLRLPAPVRTHVVLDRAPHVEPLVAMAAADRWCVALVNRSTAKLHLGDEHALRLADTVDDDVHGQHRQGGAEHRNHAGSLEGEVQQHLEHVARVLVESRRRGDFDRLLLGGPQELRGAVEERLHPDLRAALCGWIDVDMSAASADDVRRAAAPAIADCHRSHETEILDRLQAGVATEGGHGASGLADVLRALHERRVAVLVLDGGLHPAGRRCTACGLLALDGATCPADGSEMLAITDVAEAAVAAAYGQDAEVLILEGEGRLEAHGGAGAVLRF